MIHFCYFSFSTKTAMKKHLLFLSLATLTLTGFSQTEYVYPDAHFMVFSDPHYYDPSLGISGTAFQEYLNSDRKLLRESRELITIASSLILDSDAEFVIIPGDLTKDGTLVSHTEFARLIGEIEKAGKQVYVVPGNHDINNGESRAFKGDESEVVENVSPDKFLEIYREFGYGEAIQRDANSLSYVAEPVDGLWLLGLDACRYRENLTGHHPITDGIFSRETLDWIENILVEAERGNKRVMVFMHHGVVEHYKGQEKAFGEYLVDDYKKVSKLMASHGVRTVFTGHYHAQDVAKATWKDDFIFDIETGSLVTYPCPLRDIRIHDQEMTISSRFITQTREHPEDFEAYSEEYVRSGIAGIAEKTLIAYHLNPKDAAKLSGQIGQAFVVHYKGDEQYPDQLLDMTGVGLFGRIIILFKKGLVKGLYTDIYPADNNLVINLASGDCKEE